MPNEVGSIPPVISERVARRIAGDWHGGQGSALYAFVSSGAVDRRRLIAEVQTEIANPNTANSQKARLRKLLEYVIAQPLPPDEGF